MNTPTELLLQAARGLRLAADALEDLAALQQEPFVGMEAVKVDALEFSVRTGNCLRQAGIQTLGDLVAQSEDDLLGIRHFGRKSLREVRDVLANFNLQLAHPGDPRQRRDSPTNPMGAAP